MMMNFNGSLVFVLFAVLVVGLAAAASAQRNVPAPGDVAGPPDDAEVTGRRSRDRHAEPGANFYSHGPLHRLAHEW